MTSQTSSETTIQIATFRLGEEEYAVDISQVQEIVRLSDITPVPGAPDYVDGVLNLRGRVVAVMDLARRLGKPSRPRTKASRIIVTHGAGVTVGMVVDAVTEVLRLREDAIEPASQLLGSAAAELFKGVGKHEERLLILLDLPKVLSHRDSQALAAMHQEQDAHE